MAHSFLTLAVYSIHQMIHLSPCSSTRCARVCFCFGRLIVVSVSQATPLALDINNPRASNPRLIITNAGSQRFDVYQGPFTVNDQLTVSPFRDAFQYIPDVPAAVANELLTTMNLEGADKRRSLGETDTGLYEHGYIDARFHEWLAGMDKRHGLDRRTAGNLTLGYVTTDVSSHCRAFPPFRGC